MNKILIAFIFLILLTSGCVDNADTAISAASCTMNQNVLDEFDKILCTNSEDVLKENEAADIFHLAVINYNSFIDDYNNMNVITQKIHEKEYMEQKALFRDACNEYYLVLCKIYGHNKHALNFIDEHYTTLEHGYNVYDIKMNILDNQAIIESDKRIIENDLS